MRVFVPRLRDEPEREHERGDADRDVDEEDPWPGEVLRQHAAENQADGGAADRDRCPDAQRPRALLALGERRGDDRKCGRRDQRRAETLQRTRTDEHALARGKSVEERRAREDYEPDQEDPLPAEQVAGAAAEQQKAAEHEGVGVDDPLQVALGQVEVLWIDGSATFTIVASRTTMNCARQIRTRTIQGFVDLLIRRPLCSSLDC